LTSLSITQLEKITGGKALGREFSGSIAQISIDSRQIIQPEQCLFVALRGAKADGAAFIPFLISAGIRVFLVHEDWSKISDFADRATFIKVKNTREALQFIAAFQRDQFAKPVIGITGSNGKTIV